MKYTILPLLILSTLMFDLTPGSPFNKRYSVNDMVNELRRHQPCGKCLNTCEKIMINMWILFCNEACAKLAATQKKKP